MANRANRPGRQQQHAADDENPPGHSGISGTRTQQVAEAEEHGRRDEKHRYAAGGVKHAHRRLDRGEMRQQPGDRHPKHIGDDGNRDDGHEEHARDIQLVWTI